MKFYTSIHLGVCFVSAVFSSGTERSAVFVCVWYAERLNVCWRGCERSEIIQSKSENESPANTSHQWGRHLFILVKFNLWLHKGTFQHWVWKHSRTLRQFAAVVEWFVVCYWLLQNVLKLQLSFSLKKRHADETLVFLKKWWRKHLGVGFFAGAMVWTELDMWSLHREESAWHFLKEKPQNQDNIGCWENEKTWEQQHDELITELWTKVIALIIELKGTPWSVLKKQCFMV